MIEIDEQTKTFTLEKYIRRAVEYVKHRGRGNEIKVNCPFCGDKNMKGTLWLTNTYRWCYTCWRASCQCSDHGILATKWLKQVSPSMYAEYVDELVVPVSPHHDGLPLLILAEVEFYSLENLLELPSTQSLEEWKKLYAFEHREFHNPR